MSGIRCMTAEEVERIFQSYGFEVTSLAVGGFFSKT
jgi:hypothetical protein